MTSQLQALRQQYQPTLPKALHQLAGITAIEGEQLAIKEESLGQLFPHLQGLPLLQFRPGEEVERGPLRLGVVLSGGQAAGGHNVITGLFDALQHLHPKSSLIGFLNGPSGIVEQEWQELTAEFLDPYRNSGGFDMIGSGRTKIESPEQFGAALQCARELELDGLIVIGGDDSNTNAALLAEHFASEGCSTKVIGVPKTIDGDLRNEWVEISFGCDSASKSYSATIGNIARDALSAKKYYYFIKLMGRSASHITLECALQTHPNVTLIGEEIAASNMTFRQVVQQITDVVCQRATMGKHFGTVLIPEGIIEFIPEFGVLINELNTLLAKEAPETAPNHLCSHSRDVFNVLPIRIQEQLLMDRDPHGNVQVSKIETERLFIAAVEEELRRRKEAGVYSGKFSAQPMFCGYEGRSLFPSNFDAEYCYALGHVAALLVAEGRSGYMAAVRHLTRPSIEWEPCGVPLVPLMHLEERKGKMKPVIEKAMVDLKGPAFQQLQAHRTRWAEEEDYRYPGGVQYWGPEEIADARLITLLLSVGELVDI